LKFCPSLRKHVKSLIEIVDLGGIEFDRVRQFNRYLLVSRLSLTAYSYSFTYVQQSSLFLFTIAHVRHLWPGTETYRSFRVCTIALIPARIHAVRLYLQKPCIYRGHLFGGCAEGNRRLRYGEREIRWNIREALANSRLADTAVR